MRVEEEVTQARHVPVGLGMLTGSIAQFQKLVGQAIGATATFQHIGSAEQVTIKWYVMKANPVPLFYAPQNEWVLIANKIVIVKSDATKQPYSVTMTGILPATDYTQYDCELVIYKSDGTVGASSPFDDVYAISSSGFDSLDATFS